MNTSGTPELRETPPAASDSSKQIDLRPLPTGSTAATSRIHGVAAQAGHVGRRVGTRIGRYWLLLLLVLLWQYVSARSQSLQRLLPPPTDVLRAAQELFEAGTLQRDILASLRRVSTAVGVAAAIGFPLGLAMGGSKKFAFSVSPIIEFLRPIPPLAWIPLSILWFGIGDRQNEFIIFLAAVFPILLNTAAGVRDVDSQLIRAAQSLGARSFEIARTVVLPASLPSMFVGLRIGTGIAWMALVAGEIVAATTGLGYLINQGRMIFRSDYILVGMVTIGLIGLALDALIRGVESVVTPWKRGESR